MIFKQFSKNDAPLLIVLGQSNAHGHGTQLSREELPEQPFSNVYGLPRSHNQTYGLEEVVWEPFRMQDMNLGETQDYTCCLAGEFARLWQDAIEDGGNLPDLYTIQISIGAQGIDEHEIDGKNMWWGERNPVMRPGKLEEADISLYPLAIQILGAAVRQLKSMGKKPVILGLHWNQWETEVESGGEVLQRAEENYCRLFEGFYKALGERCPTYLYYPLSRVYKNEEGRKKLAGVFERLTEKSENFRLINLSNSPLWNPKREDGGIFQEDLVHYSKDAQRWFAKMQFEQIVRQEI